MSTQQSRLEMVIDTSRVHDGLSKLRVALGEIEKATQHVDNQTDQLEKGFNQTSKAANEYARALKNVAAFTGSFFAVRNVLDTAEAWTNLNNRLKLVTSTSEEAKDAQQAILDIAKSTGQPLQATADLYTRIAKNQKALNLTSKDLASVTKTVAQSMVISGASAQAGEAALIQLGQALGSGVLRGDELNSIMEQAQGLAETIAKGMGVSIGELRKLGQEGKLTAEAVISAIQSQEGEVSKAFDSMDKTIGQAMNNLNTAFTEWVGNANEGSGVTARLAEGIDYLSKNLDSVATTVAVTATAWGSYRLAMMAVSPATIATVRDAWVAVKALTTLRIATEGVTKAQLAMRLTPLGIALGAAAGAFAFLSSKTKDYGQSLLDLNEPLDQVINKINTLNEVQLDKEKLRLEQDLTSQVQQFENAFESALYKVRTTAWGASQSASEALSELAYNATMSAEQIYSAQKNLIDGWVQAGNMTANNAEVLKQKLLSVAEAKTSLDTTKSALDALSNALQNAKEKAQQGVKFDFSPKGMEKWDEYLKKLTSARDVIGMTARELARYQAEQQGANNVQAEMASIVSAQEQAYKDLEQAIKDKDSKAIEAAKNNIKMLDIEQQKIALVAEQMATIMRIAASFANGNVSANIQAGVYAAANEYYGKKQQELNQSPESLGIVKRIEKNTTPTAKGGGSKRSSSGGGGSSESELQSITKELKEQIAVLGMSDAEIQKYKISLMQGTQAERDYATAMVDKISKYKEEQETLKQSRLMADELKLFREKEMLELTTMGMGDKARQQLEEEYQLRWEFTQKRRELEEGQENESTRISEEAYQKRLEFLRMSEEERLNIIREKAEERQRLEGDYIRGLSEGLNNYANEVRNVYSQMSSAVQNWASQSTDALADFVMTGKADFKSLANSIIKDLIRIYIQQQITGLIASIMPGGSNIGVTTGSANSSFPAPTGYSTGGYITGPGTSTSDSIPAMLSNGEYVINARATRDNFALLEAINSGRSPVYRASGGMVGNAPSLPTMRGLSAQQGAESSGNITVNIVNKGSQPMGGNAKFSQDDMGNQVIDILIYDLNSNGRYARQLKGVLGK